MESKRHCTLKLMNIFSNNIINVIFWQHTFHIVMSLFTLQGNRSLTFFLIHIVMIRFIYYNVHRIKNIVIIEFV